MENIKIQKFYEDKRIRRSVSNIFVEAYYKQLSSISKDKENCLMFFIIHSY